MDRPYGPAPIIATAVIASLTTSPCVRQHRRSIGGNHIAGARQVTYPAVLLASGKRWPLAARLAMALAQHGCAVSAICPPGHPLLHVRAVRKIYPYQSLTSRASLLSAIADLQPDVIVPCDDRLVAQLHEIYAGHAELRPLIARSLGDPAGFGIVESRERLLETAAALGIRVPASCALASEEDASRCYSQYDAPAVLKLDGTCGGEGVQLARSRIEAAAAFRRLGKTARLGTTLKRLVVDRDPEALWSWSRRQRLGVSIQKFIGGIPANIMVACWQGEILGEVSVQTVSSQGLMGASNVVRLINNAELSRAARLLGARLGMSGFFGLDFVLEHGTEAAYLIEMNPRSTQLGHLRLPRGDLAGAWCAALTGGVHPPAGPVIECDTIAFFPQAWLWGARNLDPQRVHHDVPWDEKGLVEYLTRGPWQERQWPTRLYHLFRRQAPRVAVEFEALPAMPARPAQL